jgi:uncharacterized membrane protein YjjP (DUF1212 family)
MSLPRKVLVYMRLPHSYYLNMITAIIAMILSGIFLHRSVTYLISGDMWIGIIEFFIGCMIIIFGIICISRFMRKYHDYLYGIITKGKSNLEIKFK